MKRLFRFLMTAFCVSFSSLAGQNQTVILSPVFPENDLPFSLQIETASFSLPVGLQAYAGAIYKGKWVLIAGRANGLHSFNNVGNNFPPQYQNTVVYIVDPETGISISRSLSDPSSYLTQNQIDELSVTASQFFQKDHLLYIVGGYGINTGSGQMETKDTLTQINLKKLTKWVEHGMPSAKKSLRQAHHPLLKVTGGSLFQNSRHDPFLLMLGQNFAGLYTDSSNGDYTCQIRAFSLREHEGQLSIIPGHSSPIYTDYRRRDLNIAPVMRRNKPAYVGFSGVFTLDTGVWTVPITIFKDGSSFEPDPTAIDTFKQAMNHYNCAVFGLYSTHHQKMYEVFSGGISYGYFSSGTFQTDSEIPFLNQITTIKIDKKDRYTQYLMNAEYPYIVSTGSNLGNQLLFGAEALFFPKEGVPLFKNGVIKLDKLPKKPIIIGYIAGGIMSTLPNTSSSTDTTSSPYVFTVKLIPR